MAKRRMKRKRTRRKQGISLLGVAETVALANVGTNTLFNTNAFEFLTATTSNGSYGTGNQIVLRELFKPTQTQRIQTSSQMQIGRPGFSTVQAGNTFDLVMQNAKTNAVSGIVGMITVPLTFKAIKTIGRPAISKVNSLLRKAGVASVVKV